MKIKKIIFIFIFSALVIAGVSDAIRFLKPAGKNKIEILLVAAGPVDSPTTIIFVYNAYGGIYPGIIDFIKKEFFPKTYPCNLCYQAFGAFGKKNGWKNYLSTIALKQEELHKDDFRRKYNYKGELPLILISNNTSTIELVPASLINTATSLDELISLIRHQLAPYNL